MRDVVWSPKSERSMRAIHAYVSRDDRNVAAMLVRRIREGGQALGRHSTGRPGRVSGTYEKSLPRLNYILLYSLPEQAGRSYVLILDIVHAARRWPRGQMPE